MTTKPSANQCVSCLPRVFIKMHTKQWNATPSDCTTEPGLGEMFFTLICGISIWAIYLFASHYPPLMYDNIIIRCKPAAIYVVCCNLPGPRKKKSFKPAESDVFNISSFVESLEQGLWFPDKLYLFSTSPALQSTGCYNNLSFINLLTSWTNVNRRAKNTETH